MRHVVSLGLFSLVTLGTGCADRLAEPSGGTEPVDAAPTEAELTCEADGSTTLATAEVLAQPDGVHLAVRNLLDEPASLNGLGMDVDPGRSEWTLSIPPGRHEVACWPFADHGSGVEPPTTPLVVLDPDDLYVRPVELACDVRWSSIVDFVAEAEGTARDPVTAAQETLSGLRSDDVVTESRSGYPEEDRPPSVLVLRDGVAIVQVSVFQGSNGRWLVGGASGCDGTGVDAG